MQQPPKLSRSVQQTRTALTWKKNLPASVVNRAIPSCKLCKEGPTIPVPLAALHSRLCHRHPNPNVLPLPSAITSFPRQACWRQCHSAQTQAVQTLTKWWEQPDTVRWQSHRSKPEGKVPLQKPFSTSQAKRAPIGLFLSTLSLNVNSTGIRFI